MPDGLYEHDALAWAEHQSELLTRLAAGERLNESVDWEHVIEEIRDVGLSELHACQSLLRQTFVHLLKLHAEPDCPAARHWQAEIVGFLGDALTRYSPSMRQRLALDETFAVASRQFHTGAGYRKDDLRPCPFTVDELIVAEPDVPGLLAKLDNS